MASKEWYVDPASGDNGNDGTSHANAWATIQYAFDNLTQSTSQSDFVNLCASGTHTLTADLDWSSMTSSIAYPIALRGYTSTADDGGIPTIECDGYAVIPNRQGHIYFQDLKFQNTGSAKNSVFKCGHNVAFKNVEFNNFDTTGTTGKLIDYNSTPYSDLTFIDCVFTDIKGYAINNAGLNLQVRGCHFYNSGTKDFNICIYMTDGDRPIIRNNLFNLDSTSDGIDFGASGHKIPDVSDNTFFTSGTGDAVVIRYLTSHTVIENNIFEGWNVAVTPGNTHMGFSVSNNHFYDNTTDIGTRASKPFMITSDNFLSAGASVLTKSGSNTHANRFEYFKPKGDAIGNATGGRSIGAFQLTSAGGGGSSGRKLVGSGGGLVS